MALPKTREAIRFDKRLGRYICYLRTKHDMTQSDLAARLGNNFQNISRLERGETTPTLFYCERLAKAFDLSLAQFIQEFEEWE